MEDKLLVLRCKRGSSDALYRIYEKYKDDLLITAAALLNDKTAAEDVVHDVFLSFVQAVASFELKGSLKGYLATCVANRARNRNREKYARHTDLDAVEDAASQSNEADESVIYNEQAQQLHDAMHQLPYEQREVIILHLRSGLRFPQIANLRSVSVNTVKSRYRYGINKLRSILNGEAEK